jgi:type II secretory pathway pseudopilin PulG
VRRLLPVSILLFTVACAHAPKKPERPVPPALTPEAAGFFGRAASIDTVGSVVVDFDELRARDFLDYPTGERSVYADGFVSLLAAASNALKEQPTGPLLARAAVIVSLLREWDAWPMVQRAGVVLPWIRQDQPFNALMIVLAVPNDAAANETLLKGLAAADRATGQSIMALRNGRLCFTPPGMSELGPVCGAAGPGYLLFASEASIDEVSKPSIQPPPATPALFRVHANVPTFGRGDLVTEWNNGLRLSGQIVTAQPKMAEALERGLREGLQKMDAQRAEMKGQFEPLLQSTRQNLAKDPEAPPGLKAAAEKLTVDRIVDPDGFYGEFRKTIVVSRTDNQLGVEATIPEATVLRMQRQSGVFLTTATVGVLAAIAIPNFFKFKQRATQSEVRANLKAAYTAQRAYFAEYDRYGKTFEEIGFLPEKGTRYTYCMAGRCLPCTADACYIPPPKQNPCLEMTREYAEDDGTEGFLVCAVGDPKGDRDPSKLDVWTVTEEGDVHPLNEVP